MVMQIVEECAKKETVSSKLSESSVAELFYFDLFTVTEGDVKV